MITDGDLRRNINQILTLSPRDIATLNPTSVKPADLVSVALEKMEKFKVYAIVVEEEDRPVGLCVCMMFYDQVSSEDSYYHSSTLFLSEISWKTSCTTFCW